jgi:hypothetical protein
MLAFFVAAIVGGNGGARLDSVAGWLQRISIVIGFAWIAMLVLRYTRELAPTKADG